MKGTNKHTEAQLCGHMAQSLPCVHIQLLSSDRERHL